MPMNAELTALIPSVKPCLLDRQHMVSLRFTKFGYRLVRCECCGLVYLDLDVSAEDMREFYSKEYFSGGEDRRGYADYVGDQETLRLSFQQKLTGIEKRKAAGRLLDIGCATGYFLDVAKEHAWEVYGQEVSEFAGGVAAERHGDHIFIGGMDAVQLPPHSLDVITMWDVIEHLADPVDVLRRARELLKADGMLVICTGDIDSLLARLQGSRSRIYNPPQHLYYFSRRTLSRTLESAGLRVLEVSDDWKTMTLEYFAYVLAVLNPNPITHGFRRWVQRWDLRKRAIKIPLIDNMRVYAVVV